MRWEGFHIPTVLAAKERKKRKKEKRVALNALRHPEPCEGPKPPARRWEGFHIPTVWDLGFGI